MFEQWIYVILINKRAENEEVLDAGEARHHLPGGRPFFIKLPGLWA
jgi:hypothetical protein